jgi:eukaryotic-like serine/threonine-protein kinase
MTPQPAPPVMFEPGTIVDGRYRIVSLIGVGGVGRVYLARHLELDSEVAIKVLRPDMADRPEAVQRFAREARASVRLRSDRIARVLDVGSHEGKPYFVMEYLLGCTLLDVRDQPGVDIATLCEFFIQACEGLADAHAQGVVHRDVKPENLFVVRDASGWRSLKILDFGISKFSLTGRYSDVDLAGMRTEAMMGTPHYISPEQIRASRDVDHRTDIWSLGAVIFEVVSGGVLPFREEREVTALVAEVLEQPHRSLLDVAPNTPERLAMIVDRCLVKNRDERYQTAAEVALDLLPLAPVRARASVERAVSVMQAAGLMALNADMDSLRRPQYSTGAPSSGSGRAPVTPQLGGLEPPVSGLVIGSGASSAGAPGRRVPTNPAERVGTIASATPVSSAPAPTTASLRAGGRDLTAPSAETSRKHWGLVLLALLVAALLGVGGLVLLRAFAPAKSAEPASPGQAQTAGSPVVLREPEAASPALPPGAVPALASAAAAPSSAVSAQAAAVTPKASDAKKAVKPYAPQRSAPPVTPAPVKAVESPGAPPKLELRRER